VKRGQVVAGLGVVALQEAPLAMVAEREGLLAMMKLPQMAVRRERYS